MLRYVNQCGEYEEYPFVIKHMSPNVTHLQIISPNEPILPRFLTKKLHIGQEVEVRRISNGESKYSRAIEILNQPIDWWTTQPGFETLLVAQKMKPLPPMTPPNCDMIDNYFNVDQKMAISAAIDNKRSLVVINGPCGSGKTAIASEVINKVA